MRGTYTRSNQTLCNDQFMSYFWTAKLQWVSCSAAVYCSAGLSGESCTTWQQLAFTSTGHYMQVITSREHWTPLQFACPTNHNAAPPKSSSTLLSSNIHINLDDGTNTCLSAGECRHHLCRTYLKLVTTKLLPHGVIPTKQQHHRALCSIMLNRMQHFIDQNTDLAGRLRGNNNHSMAETGHGYLTIHLWPAPSQQ